MKEIMIGLLAMTSSVTAIACSCASANHSIRDANTAVEKFMADKRGVEASEITSMDASDYEGYLRGIQHIGTFLEYLEYKFGDTGESGYSCGTGCMYGMNTRYSYLVTYNKNQKHCTQKLTVEIEDDLFAGGFSSIVKKKLLPVCN
ncbi:MAG: hypothetical protein HON90_05545 [Halobacteriovoraceae bacterium]|jgi:hypothetical protein|nr:hypothetical protein [Halobacteriovoraceae bacterium]